MSFFDKIKNLFKNKDFPVKSVTTAPQEKQEDSENEQIKEDSNNNETNLEETHEEVQEVEKYKEYNKEEALEILDSIKIDIDSLALEKIQSEAETLNSYAKMLIKDISNYQDFKDEKDKVEAAIKGIAGKIKVINNHGLELKNLLANLENHYYSILIKGFKKLYEKTENDDVQKVINDIEKDLQIIKNLDTKITKVIGYNELFNPEKNPEYKKEIEKEAVKRIIHGDLNELISNMLFGVIHTSLSAKSKIEKFDYVEIIKERI